MNLGQLTGIVVAGAFVTTAINVNEDNKTMAGTLATAGLSTAGVVLLDIKVRNKKPQEIDQANIED